MLVFVIDKNGKMGHPTRKCGMIRRKLKNGSAKVVRRFGKTIVVQLKEVEFKDEDTIDCKFVLGIDPGYKYIGYYIIKLYKNKVFDILSGEVETRTEEIKKLLSDRKMYRQARRRHRRVNVKRKLGCRKFRHPRWSNRTHPNFTPTHIHLIQTHLNLLKKLTLISPIDEINLEYFKFDSQKVLNPDISGVQYQQGIRFGFTNTRAYVLERDKHSCQSCGEKDIPLNVHHIVERSQGGSDLPSNLITLCINCHKEIHTGTQVCPKITNTLKMRDSGVLNSCMKKIYEYFSGVRPTKKVFGCETKYIRKLYGIEKGHRNDAFCISIRYLPSGIVYDGLEGNIINFKQFRRHNRSFTTRIEDRKYYVLGSRKIVARNRRRRSGQNKKKDICLVELRQMYPKIQVVAKPGGRISKFRYDQYMDEKGKRMYRIGNQLKVGKDILTITDPKSTQQRVYFGDFFYTFTQLRSISKYHKWNTGLVSV